MKKLINKLRGLSPIPNYGDHFTIEEFTEMVKSGAIIDDDGFGNYATEDGMSSIEAAPSDIYHGRVNTAFSHVVWFNK